MVALVVPNFQGLAPRYADRLLSESQASYAANLKIGNGDLRGFKSLLPVTNLAPTLDYRRVIKIYDNDGDPSHFTWFKSEDVEASALKSALAQDAFDRIYFTDNNYTALRVVTYDDLAAGNPSLPAGVPRPTAAPTVTPASGGTPETRAYVYTWQTAFGSEGAPSPPTLGTGNQTGTWTIGGFGTPPVWVNRVNIYRSATGEESSGAYYLVGTIVLPGSSFADSMAGDLVPLQRALDSYNNDVPPDGLKGLTLHSSGAFAAFKGRTVYFSEPYLGHAWNQNYTYPVDDLIVGIAAILNYIVVLTTSVPVLLVGNHPSQISITKLPDIEPCTSARSIVVMAGSVMFASPNGICSISQTGLGRPTNPLITKDEFSAYQPNDIVAASHGSYYIAFYQPSLGFAVAMPPYEPISFMPLDRYSGVTAVDMDTLTGDCLITQGSAVKRFDALKDRRFPTTFRSKEFINPKPINLGAVQILFKPNVEEDDSELLVLQAMEDYNAERFAAGPLDTFDMYTFDGAAGDVWQTDDYPELSGLPPIQPLGGEPLFDIAALVGVETTRFVLLAGSTARYVKVISDEKVHSLPSGYKATRFYLEVSGSAQIQRIVVAETRRECRTA